MKYVAIALMRGHRWDGQLLCRVDSAAPPHAAKARAGPDTKIVDVMPTRRREPSIWRISRLVDNRSEVNAPLTVQTLVERPQTDP